MPWYIEPNKGQAQRREATGACLTPHYGEDEHAARRAARKASRTGGEHVAVYVVPLSDEKLAELAQRPRTTSNTGAFLFTLASSLLGASTERRR